MLPKNQMVKARKAIELLYFDKCTITEYQKVKKENKSTGFEEVVVLEEEPCRLSYKNVTNTNQTETAASSVVQITKVFLSPEIKVKPGSKLTVTHKGVTVEYKNSGEPAIYDTHQELVLELFKGWA